MSRKFTTLSFILVFLLAGWSAAFADLPSKNTQTSLNYLLSRTASNYERQIIHTAFEQRYPSLGSRLSGYLSREESLRYDRLVRNTCGTPLQAELLGIVMSLGDPYALKVLREQLYSKPAALDKKVSDDTFEVWYTDDSVKYTDAVTKEYAEKVLDYMAKSHATEITSWSYKKGLSEDDANAGKAAAKYQVYIYKAGTAYGTTYFDAANASGSATVARTFTHIVIAPAVAPDDLLLDTCAHEYHHASEAAYATIGASIASFLWYLEGSTTWIAYQVRKQYADPTVAGTGSWDLFKDRAEYFQDHPEVGLDHTKTTVTDDYDAGLFMWFMAHNKVISGAGRGLVLKFWQKIGEMNDWNKPFDAFDHALSGLGTSYKTFKKIFPYFAAANYAVSRWYPETIKGVKIVNKTSPHKLDYSTSSSHQVAEQTVNVDHLGIQYFKFVPGPTLTKPTILNIAVDGGGKEVNAIAIAKKTDGSFVEYPFNLDTSTTGKAEVGVSAFCTAKVKEVVLAVMNYSASVDATPVKYKASLTKPITFAIDDTGSMYNAIAGAKAAAIKVLTTNKANKAAGKGGPYFYTLYSFKDGSGTLRGQTEDEDTMIGYVNTLSAWGGAGIPESSLLTTRQAAKKSEGADIFLMTDAPSNSYGADDTYASWGEVLETVYTLTTTNCRLHVIYFSSSGTSAASSGGGQNREAWTSNYSRALMPAPASVRSGVSSDNPYGMAGYNRLTSETGGLFFQLSSSPTVTDAEKATTVILTESTSTGTIAFADATRATADAAASYTVPVDSTFTDLQLTLNGGGGSSVALAVKNPAGAAVSAGANVTVTSIAGTTSYTITGSDLAAGSWTATVTGNGSYRLVATGSTTNPMDYTGGTSVGKGSTLALKANFRTAVSSPVFTLVKLDGTVYKTVTMTTTDNINFTGSAAMSDLGAYRFLANASGNVQRIQSGEITVGSLQVTAPTPVNRNTGESVTHTFQVKNLGTAQDTYNLSATSSLGWADLTGVPANRAIAAGETYSLAIPVRVPAAAGYGEVDVLSLQAISQANSSIGAVDQTETRNVVTVAQPSFDPAAGTFSGSVTVTISTTTTGASIRYTTDGSTPSQTNGTLISGTSGTVSISSTTTLMALAFKEGMEDSAVTSGVYTITVPESEAGGGGGGGGGGCFIATAAFGSPLAPYVETLRTFRDTFLLPTRAGQKFVEFYYRYSPPLAEVIARHDGLRAAVRWSLLPVVGLSYVAVQHGPAAALALMGGFFFVLLPACWFTLRARKPRRGRSM